MEKPLYFAYGSNINLDQMRYRCPDASVYGQAVLDNYDLRFRGSGVATVEPKEGACVYGLLWELTDKCEASLDRYLLWVLRNAPGLSKTDEAWAEKLLPANAPEECYMPHK